MTSTATRPVAPWMARLPWVLLAITVKFDAGRREQFGAQLRDQVGLTDIGSEPLAVMEETVHPAHVSPSLRRTGPPR